MTYLVTAAPALIYLAVLTVILVCVRKCPPFVHLIALAAGLGWRGMTQSPVAALIGLACGVMALVVLTVVARRLLSSVGLLAVSVSVALLPFADWPGLAVGLTLAGATATAWTLRSGGKTRVSMLAGETLSAMGVTPTGLARPDLSNLPASRDQSAASSSHRLYLPPFLFTGMAVWIAGQAFL